MLKYPCPRHHVRPRDRQKSNVNTDTFAILMNVTGQITKCRNSVVFELYIVSPRKFNKPIEQFSF